MKNRCYPKYSCAVFILLAAISFVLSVGPLFIWTNDALFVKILWSASMTLLGIVFTTGAIQYMQYYCFEGNNIVVKSLFGTIVKLNIEKAQIHIETLPTYFSWIASIDEKWICIYDESISVNVLNRFKSGCSNGRKHKRIQIIFTEANMRLIEHHLSTNV